MIAQVNVTFSKKNICTTFFSTSSPLAGFYYDLMWDATVLVGRSAVKHLLDLVRRPAYDRHSICGKEVGSIVVGLMDGWFNVEERKKYWINIIEVRNGTVKTLTSTTH